MNNPLIESLIIYALAFAISGGVAVMIKILAGILRALSRQRVEN